MSILHGPNNNLGDTYMKNVEEALVHYAVPALGTTTYVHAAITSPATGTTVVTTAITNPDVTRNLTVTGSASGMTGNVVIAGTNWDDSVISETFALSGTATIVGNLAYKTVTSITVPAKVNSSGDTVAVGTGAKLGLPIAMDKNLVIRAFLNKVVEGTAPTVAVSSTYAIESCTASLNSALNGTDVDILFFYQ